MHNVLQRWQMVKVELELEDCGSSAATALAPPDGSHRALSLRQARQARDALGRFAPLGMRVLILALAASDIVRERIRTGNAERMSGCLGEQHARQKESKCGDHSQKGLVI